MGFNVNDLYDITKRRWGPAVNWIIPNVRWVAKIIHGKKYIITGSPKGTKCLMRVVDA